MPVFVVFWSIMAVLKRIYLTSTAQCVRKSFLWSKMTKIIVIWAVPSQITRTSLSIWSHGEKPQVGQKMGYFDYCVTLPQLTLKKIFPPFEKRLKHQNQPLFLEFWSKMAVLKAFFDLLEHSASENRFYGRKWLKSLLFGL